MKHLVALVLAAGLVGSAHAKDTVAEHAVSSPGSAPQVSGDERALWDLEHAYWRYVEDNDLASYSALWHPSFLGWPSVSPAPVRKDHITDWITSQTSKGLKFRAGGVQPASIQVTGDVAFACYWIRYAWVGEDGNGSQHVLRITHAWVRSGGRWQIIGGMSMPEPEKSSK